jgi:hypothetical protein
VADAIYLLSWLAMSGAVTVSIYRAGGIKTKEGAWLIWLLIFLAPILSYLGFILAKSTP